MSPTRLGGGRQIARRSLAALWHNVGFACAALALTYCVAHAFEPPRLNWGDVYSDYNTMIAGRNFARYGFVNLRLTPLIMDRSVVTAADSTMGYVYTHYPPLPDLMNGGMRTVFGMTGFPPFRLVALAFSFGALFFVYQLVARWWSRQTAQIAIALWVTNALWLQHADYLHHGPYGAFFGFGSLYFLSRFLDAPSVRHHLGLSGAFLFLAYFSSYDYWIFTPLLIVAMTIAHYRGRSWRSVAKPLATLGAFATAAVVCKMGLDIWALDGIKPFLRDLQYQGLERSTDRIVRTRFGSGLWPMALGRTDRFFSLLFAPVVAFWMVAALRRRHWASRWPSFALPRVNPLVLFLAALPFLAAFRELWMAQYYPGLMIVPFYAVGFAALIVALLDSSWHIAKPVAIGILVGITGNAVNETAHFQRAFFDPRAIVTLRAQLDSLAPRGQWVMANHMFADSYRYFFDRNMVPLIMHQPSAARGNIAHFSDPAYLEYSTLLVQHKHVTDELYDKGYYWILARYKRWDALANPRDHRPEIDSLVVDRDRAIVAEATRVGRKLYENDFYVLWSIPPSAPAVAR